MALILVLHPDADIRLRLRSLLEDDGHWTLGASSVAYAQERLLSHRPDAAFISADANAATTSRVVESFKQSPRGKKLTVVLLWEGATTADPTETLAWAHADALLSVQPLVPDDVRECVRSLLEAPPGRTGERYIRYGHLELDQETRTARLGSSVKSDIPEKHFSLLWFLAKRAMESGGLCPREIILSRLWKNKVRDREVDVTISRLKSRVPFLAPFIESVPRKGYRLLLPFLSPQKP